MTARPWQQRAARARLLAEGHPAAAEILRFYARLAEYQSSVAASVAGVGPSATLDAVPGALAWLSREAPPPLAEAAAALSAWTRAEWEARLASHPDATDENAAAPAAGAADAVAPGDAHVGFVLDVVEQALAAGGADAVGDASPSPGQPQSARCPSCGALPVVGLLREEGHGARRGLVCGRCLREWGYRRLCCPGCGEERFESLPVFTAEQFPHVRVDACDSCHRYLKTLDLTKDGLADPMADDVASLPVDLWARAQGYERLRPGLLRL